jgi:hypothetical protein
MKRAVMISAIMLGLATSPALADGKKAKKHSNIGLGDTSQFCPPGLAKKNPPCVPPGQAKKRGWSDDHHDGHVYRIGDVIHDSYRVVRNPLAYGLDPNGTYWRVGDNFFRVDGESGRVLATLGMLTALLD